MTIPVGWFATGKAPEDYSMELDSTSCHSGIALRRDPRRERSAARLRNAGAAIPFAKRFSRQARAPEQLRSAPRRLGNWCGLCDARRRPGADPRLRQHAVATHPRRRPGPHRRPRSPERQVPIRDSSLDVRLAHEPPRLSAARRPHDRRRKARAPTAQSELRRLGCVISMTGMVGVVKRLTSARHSFSGSASARSNCSGVCDRLVVLLVGEPAALVHAAQDALHVARPTWRRAAVPWQYCT